MEQVKTSVALLIAVLLQLSLPIIAPWFTYVDFPLLIIVYVALQRESLKAMLYATVAGLAVDALGNGLLGAGGFSKTVTAYVVAEIARRVLLDNPLLRIPVIAGASALTNLIYFSMHRLLGQTTTAPFPETIGYAALGTTVAGTIVMLLIEWFFSDRARLQRRANSNNYTARRSSNTGRRNTIRLGKRI